MQSPEIYVIIKRKDERAVEHMTIGYGITLALALGLLLAYFLLIKQREFWLGVLFICVVIVNLGYFVLSVAPILPVAILGNNVAYLGSIFLSVCMLLTIVRLCGFSIRARLVIFCLVLAALMFSLVLTSGFLPWYYSDFELDTSGTSTKLIKTYGPLHFTYLIYLLGYFSAMIVTIIVSVRQKRMGSPKLAGLLAGVVCGNILVWLFEKLIPSNFEVLSVTYIFSEIVLLLLYWMMQDYVHVGELDQIISKAEPMQYKDISQMPQKERLDCALALLPPGEMLAEREREVLALILENQKRKDIAEQLHISENTVKTHTRNLYAKLGVANREDLYSRILNP